jgi:hypothetical protein
MAEMSHLVQAGLRDLLAAFPDLAKVPDAATAAADRAIHQHRKIERVNAFIAAPCQARSSPTRFAK